MSSSSNFLGAITDHMGTPSYLDRTYGQPLFHTETDILSVVFDEDGSIWTIEECGLLRNWSINGRQLSRTFLSDLETCWQFCPRGQYLASGSDDLALWNYSSGQLIEKVSVGLWVTCFAFSNDGKFLASGHDDGTVRIWGLPGLKQLATLQGHSQAVSSIAFHGEGEKLATAGEDRKIQIWNWKNQTLLQTLSGHPDRIPALVWQPSGEHLLSAGWDHTVRVWDIRQSDPLMLLNTHSEQVYCLAYSPTGEFLACADSDYEIHFWSDWKATQPARHLRGHSEEITSMAFSPDGKRFVSGGADRVVRVWDVASGDLLAGIQSEQRNVIAVVPSPRRANLFSSQGPSMQAWETESAQLGWFPPTSEKVRSIAASRDGRWIATSGESAEVELWDALAHARVRTLTHTKGPISSLQFSPDGNRLASASLQDGLVWLWDIQESEAILVIPEAADACTLECIDFHPTKNILAVGGYDFLSTGGSDGAVCLWDLDSRDKYKTFQRGVTSLAVDPSAKYLAAGALNYNVIVWDLETDAVVFDLPGHTERIGAIAFSPDGSWLISASDDSTLRVWNVLNGRLVVARQFDTGIQSLAFSQDGKYVYTGNANSTCFRLSIDSLIED